MADRQGHFAKSLEEQSEKQVAGTLTAVYQERFSCVKIKDATRF